MPTSIAKVRRSRRICTNSFSMIAMTRASENALPAAGRGRDDAAGTLALMDIVFRVLHQADEHVFERRLGLRGCQARHRARWRERGLEGGGVVTRHVQRRAKWHDRLHGSVR